MLRPFSFASRETELLVKLVDWQLDLGTAAGRQVHRCNEQVAVSRCGRHIRHFKDRHWDVRKPEIGSHPASSLTGGRRSCIPRDSGEDIDSDF
jgi:hypothetical protein